MDETDPKALIIPSNMLMSRGSHLLMLHRLEHKADFDVPDHNDLFVQVYYSACFVLSLATF